MNKNILVVLLLVLVLGAGIRAIPVMQHENIIGYDIFFHLHSTEALMEKGLLSYDNYGCQGRILDYPPGFHVFLAILSPLGLQVVAQWLPVFLTVLSALALFILTKYIFNEKIALLSVLLMIIGKEFFTATVSTAPQLIDFVLIPLIFYIFLRYIHTDKKQYIVSGFLLLVALSLIHPLGYIIAAATLFIYFAIERQWKNTAIIGVSTIPVVLWFLLFIAQTFIVPWWGGDPIFKFITDFGLILPVLGLAGLLVYRKIDNQNAKLAVIWLLVTTAGFLQFIIGKNILAVRFLPYMAQAYALFSGVTLYYVYLNLNKQIRKKVFFAILGAVIVLMLVSSVLAIQYVEPIISNSDKKAIEWIEQNTTQNADFAVIPPHAGMFLSYYAQRKTLVCPFRETVSRAAKRGEAAYAIYYYKDDTQALEYLKEFDIEYIYFTEKDRYYLQWLHNLGYEANGWKRFERLFSIAYENNNVRIYRVY